MLEHVLVSDGCVPVLLLKTSVRRDATSSLNFERIRFLKVQIFVSNINTCLSVSVPFGWVIS